MRKETHQHKKNGLSEKIKDISDLVFDCVVLVRLHGLRGVLLLRIGGLTLSDRRGRLALLICRRGGGDRLIDLHLSVIFDGLKSRFGVLLGSGRRGLGLLPSRIWFFAGLFLLDTLT